MSSAADETTPLSEAGYYNMLLGPRFTQDDYNSLRAGSVDKIWGWIFAAGLLSLLAGTGALTYPIWTSSVVLWWLAMILLVVGVVNVSGLWFADIGQRWSTFWCGVVQVIIALFAFFHPVPSLVGITLTIAFVFMLEGLYRIVLSCQNKDVMENWGIVCFNGVVNILLSIVILTAMPLSGLYTIGVLLGCNLIVSGMSYMSLACFGRRATNAIESEISGGAMT